MCIAYLEADPTRKVDKSIINHEVEIINNMIMCALIGGGDMTYC